MKTVQTLALTLTLSLLFIACSPAPAPQVQATPAPEAPQIELTLLDSQNIAKRYYLDGLNYQYAGKEDYAAFFFEKAIQLDPSSEYLRTSLAEAQRKIGKTDDAVATLKSRETPLDSLSEESLLLLAHLSLDLNQPDSADIYYDVLTRKNPTNGKYWWEWAQSLEESKNFHKLADVNRQLVPIMDYPDQFIYRQILLYSVSQRQAEIPAFLEEVYGATQNIKWLKDAQERYENARDQENHLRVLAQLEKLEPYEFSYKLKRIKQLPPQEAAQQLWSQWQELTQQIQQDTTVDSLQRDSLLVKLANFPMDAARLSLYAKDYPLAKTITDTLIHLQPQESEAWSLASGATFMAGDTTESLEYALKAWQQSNEEFKYASLYSKMLGSIKSLDSSSAWLDKVRRLNKDPLLLNLHLETDLSRSFAMNEDHYQDPAYAQAYRDLNQKNLDKIDSLIALTPFEGEDFPSLYLLKYRKAIILEKLDAIPEVIQIFDELLSLDSTDAAVLNYYGYTLIDRDIDIAKGQVYVQRALAQQPKTNAYLDSHAWGLFKQGKFQEALDILLKIQPEEPTDFYILEHIARCYQALNDTENFQATLLKLKKLAPHHPLLKEQ